MGLRIAPMKLAEICAEVIITAVTGIRDKAKVILTDEQLYSIQRG